MSLFIAGQAVAAGTDFAAAKIAVFAASILSSLIGVGILWFADAERNRGEGRVAPRQAVAESDCREP
jgi:NhaA family Na+:H+ antiporter